VACRTVECRLGERSTLHAERPRDTTSAVTAEFTLRLLDCDRRDPLADFFDAHATVASRDVRLETAFVVAGRDLRAFAHDLDQVSRSGKGSALLLGGWETERHLRLHVTRADRSGAGVARVWMVNDNAENDADGRGKAEFVVPLDALSRFSMDIHQLVERREPGDLTLTGEADGIE
jgi:hypothetical protein